MRTFDKKFSVILPTAGDPLILWMWFKNFKKYKHLTDNCFVGIDFCHTMEDNDPRELVEMYQYFVEFFKEQGVENYAIRKFVSQHGLNISMILDLFKDKISDNVLIAEEDDYVANVYLLEKNIEHFLNDDVDILGPPIYMSNITDLSECYREVIKSKPMVIKNQRDFTAFTYWPATYLIKKEHLYNSTMNFGASSWKTGDVMKMYDRDFVYKQDVSFDTFIKFTFECMDNPKVKKMTHVLDFHRCYITDSIIFGVKGNRNMHDVLDYHIGGTSAFIFNRFWRKDLYEAGSYYSRLKNLVNKDVLAENLVDYYRTVYVIYHFFMSMRDKKEFPFYENYKKHMEFILDLYESEYKVKEKLERMCPQLYTEGLDCDLYQMIAKKLF